MAQKGNKTKTMPRTSIQFLARKLLMPQCLCSIVRMSGAGWGIRPPSSICPAPLLRYALAINYPQISGSRYFTQPACRVKRKQPARRKTMPEFNLNDKVRVKLTERGRAALEADAATSATTLCRLTASCALPLASSGHKRFFPRHTCASPETAGFLRPPRRASSY